MQPLAKRLPCLARDHGVRELYPEKDRNAVHAQSGLVVIGRGIRKRDIRIETDGPGDARLDRI